MTTKRGRRRKRGERYANGRLKYDRKKRGGWAGVGGDSPAILVESLLQRGAKIRPDGSLDGVEMALRPEAGYVVGRLMLADTITLRQYNAVMRFAAAWRRWASLAGLTPHVLSQREGGSHDGDVSVTAWRNAKSAFMGASVALRACGLAVWRLVEMLAMDDRLPWCGLPAAGPMVDGLRDGLDALGDHYGMPLDKRCFSALPEF